MIFANVGLEIPNESAPKLEKDNVENISHNHIFGSRFLIKCKETLHCQNKGAKDACIISYAWLF